MSKERKSNKEAKKKPALTMKEKKAAKKSKKEEDSALFGLDRTTRGPTTVAGAKR